MSYSNKAANLEGLASFATVPPIHRSGTRESFDDLSAANLDGLASFATVPPIHRSGTRESFDDLSAANLEGLASFATVPLGSFFIFAASVLLTASFLSFAHAEEPERLTSDGILKRDPQFIDGGKSLIYGYDEKDDLVRVLKLDLETLKAEPLVKDVANKHQIEPKLSSDGRLMTVTECTGNLTAKLIIRDLEKKKDVAITHSGRGGTRSPVFSPDNTRVVYAFAETGPQQLWSVKIDGKDKKQLTQCEGISNWPTFTPDGKTIVFSNSRENNYELYSMDADGGNERRLTKNTLMDIRPSVSPDGKQVAFTSTRDGFYNVYVMNIDGSKVRQVTHSEDRDDYPAWHPDGKKLAIVSERAGRFDLYLYEVPAAAAGAGAGEAAKKEPGTEKDS